MDPLLAGDRETIEAALKASGYGTTIADARQYLNDWIDTMKPEYMMASTPHDFTFDGSSGGTLSGVKKLGLNEDSLQDPFAFTDLSGIDCKGCEETDQMPSIINEDSDFLTDVLMKGESVCTRQIISYLFLKNTSRKIIQFLMQIPMFL